MTFLKKHLIVSLLILCILLTLLFILGETSWKTTLAEVTQYIPPAQTQLAQVTAPTSGLIAHYTFDDTTNDSAGSNHGTASGGPTYVAGKIGKAMSFDGVDDYVASVSGVSVPASGEFSLSLWMKNTGLTSGAVVAWGSNRFCDRDGTALVCTVDGNSSSGASSNGTYNGSWHHIVFVVTGNTQVIYRDGVRVGSATKVLSTSGGTVRLANRLSSSSFYAGAIDDVRLYSRPLDSSEISSLYSLGNETPVDTGGTSSGGTTTTGSGSSTVDTNPPSSGTGTTPTETVPPATTASGPNWYVDANVSVSGTGGSWASAWKSFSAIDWTKIQSGHTIWISGATYNETLTVSKGGVAGAPVSIKTGREAGHDGLVVINGAINVAGNYVSIDGARSDSYNSVRYTADVALLDRTQTPSSNVNLVVTRGINIFSGYSQGHRIRWVDITNLDVENAHGIRMNPDPNPVRDVEIAYVWIHDVGQDAITLLSNSSASFDNLVVHHSLMERMGDDGLEIAGGTTVHHSIIRRSRFARGHPDGIQSTGNYLRFYNNIFADFGSSLLLTQGVAPEGGDYGHIHIYGNVFYKKEVPVSTTEIELKWYPASTAFNRSNVYYRDWIIAYNTFAYLNAGGVSFQARRPESGVSGTVEFVHPRAIITKGNIFYDCTSTCFGIPYGISRDRDKPTIYNTWDWTMNDVALDYNIFSSLTPAGLSMGYYGSAFARAEDLNAATIYTHNSSARPAFVNASGFNFQLTSTDTAARNKGENLSSLGLPGLSTDMAGTPRGRDGIWDIGALEATSGTVSSPTTDNPETLPSSGLVLHLPFDTDDFATAQADTYKTIRFNDASGSGVVTDCQSAFALNGQTYNQCPTITTGPKGGRAALFAPLKNLCDISGDYLAVTKKSSLSTLAQGTISLWVSAARTDDVTHKLLDTYRTTIPRTWQLHRDGDRYYTFTINDNSGSSIDMFTFPGGSTPAGTWNHYALSWNGITVSAYYNGVLFATYPMSSISSFDMSYYLGIGALIHNSPRNTSDGGNCTNQYGAPAGSYVFPNAGFFSGAMDDIRIYNRPLSSGEIVLLASQTDTVRNEYILRVDRNGTGTGSVTGGGIGCGKHCAESYNPGTSVNLVATPSPDSVFAGWSGSCSGTGTCNISMSNHRTVTATFTRVYTPVGTFSAPSGTISAPFIVTASNTIYQPIQTSTVSAGGKALYTFTAPETGEYIISAKVNASSQSANSFYVNIDTEPTGDTMAWHISTTGGFEQRFVSWGGSTSGGNPVKIFNLSAGQHTLIIRGREADAAIESIEILKKGTGAVTSPTTLKGDFNSDGRVNSLDFSALQSKWNQASPPHDLNADGIVNTLDYSILVQNWTG